VSFCPDHAKVSQERIEYMLRLASLDTEITCPECGAKNPSTAKQCVSCGASEEELREAMAGVPMMPGAPGMPVRQACQSLQERRDRPAVPVCPSFRACLDIQPHQRHPVPQIFPGSSDRQGAVVAT